LITGPWYSQSSVYQVLFDGSPVPTTLVQSGVLRCHCPGHSPGEAVITVACGDTVISEPVIFTYKEPATEPPRRSTPDLGSRGGGGSLKHRLLHRLLNLGICSSSHLELFYEDKFSDFEDQLVTMCQKLTTEEWEEEDWSGSTLEEKEWRGPPADVGGEESLLHLSASLGLSRLVCSLLHWVAEHPGKRIGREVDALARDQQGYTPLMAACSQGNREVATILYHWNSAAVHIPDLNGQSCATVAGQSSCPQFKAELERMERQKKKELMESKLSKESKSEFLKPTGKRFSKKVDRAPSLEGYLLGVPGSTRRSPSPLRSPSLRSASVTAVRALRAGSPATSTADRKVKLIKRPSVDSGINVDVQSVRCAWKEGRQLSKKDRSASLPSSGFQKSLSNADRGYFRQQDRRDASFPGSPLIDVEGVSGDEEDGAPDQDEEVKSQDDEKVLTLAEQFLAAMPDRIKFQAPRDLPVEVDGEDECMQCVECCCSSADCCSEDLGVESMADDHSVDFEFNFEEACHSYRDTVTPSLSPASMSVESPRSSMQDSPSPATFTFGTRSPSTADLSEFLQAKCEKDMSNLTLNEREQRELFQAAQIIQKAYRSYKGRMKPVLEEGGMEEEKEARAAVIIQNYYRRYKQFCYWKRMAKAATVIQKNYRTYCEHKRYRKNEEAATCIQTYYRNYRELQGRNRKRNSEEKEGTPTNGVKRTFSQRRQNQAARKIQQFMRKTHLNTINEVSSPRTDTGERPGCYTCRKREAPDPRHTVPAKLPGHHSNHYPPHPYMFQGAWNHSANKI